MNGWSNEGVIALLGLVFMIAGAVWIKLDQIWKTISDIKVNSVTHDTCHTRRKECQGNRKMKKRMFDLGCILILALILLFAFGCRTEYYPDGKVKSEGFHLGTQGNGSYGLIVVQIGDDLGDVIK